MWKARPAGPSPRASAPPGNHQGPQRLGPLATGRHHGEGPIRIRRHVADPGEGVVALLNGRVTDALEQRSLVGGSDQRQVAGVPQPENPLGALKRRLGLLAGADVRDPAAHTERAGGTGPLRLASGPVPPVPPVQVLHTELDVVGGAVPEVSVHGLVDMGPVGGMDQVEERGLDV